MELSYCCVETSTEGGPSVKSKEERRSELQSMKQKFFIQTNLNSSRVKLPDLMATTTKYLTKALKQNMNLNQRNERMSLENTFNTQKGNGSILRQSHDGGSGLYKRYKKSQQIHDFGNNEHTLPSS